MWSGIESDVQLFASGRVLHDDGEWAGGQSLGEDSGSGMYVVPWLLVAASARPVKHSSLQRVRFCNVGLILKAWSTQIYPVKLPCNLPPLS